MKCKRIAGLLVCGLFYGPLAALPLNQQSQEEKKFLLEFASAAYAQRDADPQRFAKLRRLLKKQPDSAYLKQQLVSEALAADVVELADRYADFIEDETVQDDPDAWAVYGAYRWRKGEPVLAAQAYEKALALDPDDERILFQYITVLVTSDPDKAAQTLDMLAQSRPLFASDIFTETGRMYLFHKRYEEAVAAFDRALALDPQLTAAHFGKAEAYEKTNQYFLMLHELEEVDKRGLATAGVLARMGAVYVLVQDLPQAEKYFTRAKQADKGNLAAGNFLALLAERRGEYEKAIRFLQETQDYTEDPAKQIQVSYYERKLNEPEKSFATLRRAYERFPTQAEVGYWYAIALNEREEFKQAERILQTVVEHFPNSQEARMQYAFALEGSHRYEKMEEQVHILLEKNPQDAAALNLLAFSLAERGQRLDEAAEYSARALAVWPQDHSLQDTQAWIFYKQGRYQAAADLFRAIPPSYVQENPEMAYHAGMIYAALGQTEEARALLTQAAQGGWKPARKALKKLK